MNAYWQMLFRNKCRVMMENLSDKRVLLYYQIDCTLTDVPDDAAYFHAQFNRVHPLPHKEDYTIVENIKGKGQYMGTYLGFHYFLDNPDVSYQLKIGQYRWHILDPVRFENDLKVTIQSLGWKGDGSGRYKHLQDDLASVAYWYQQEPHNPFPDLPANKNLILKKEDPNPMKEN